MLNTLSRWLCTSRLEGEYVLQRIARAVEALNIGL